jgi:hypothetical protein
MSFLSCIFVVGAGDIFQDEQRAIRFSHACSTEVIERAIENLKS